MNKLFKKININYLYIFLIFILSVINLRYFFKPGIFRGHDLDNHLARIANYYLAFKDKQIPPRWAKNLNFKFGYPVFNYNYPLANILSTPLIKIKFNIEDSLKIILFASYFFSGLFFYLWQKKSHSQSAAFLGSIIYLTSPYIFLDLYVRGVVGENLSFSLFPAILYFLILFKEKPNVLRFLLFAGSTTMFSLSHNVMVLIFTPLIFLYTIYQLKSEKRSIFLLGLLALVFGYLLTSFFWIPAFFESKFVTLEAFNPKTFYLDHFIFLKQLIYSPWTYGYSVAGDKDTMSFQLGPIHWVVVILSTFLAIKNFFNKQKQWASITKIQILFWLTIFLMLPISQSTWKIMPFIGYLQFPWRLLSLAIFCIALLAVIVFEKYKKLGLILALAGFIYSLQFTRPFFWEKKSDMEYYDFLFTTSVLHENMPRWFQEGKSDQFKPRMTSETGTAVFKELSWLTGKHIYEIDSPTHTFIWEHTAYFPGWKAFVDNKETQIKFDNPEYPGLIGFQVPPGRHLITTKFTELTKSRVIGDLLSALSIILLGLITIFIKKWQTIT